jgi:NADH-quinone oxidoreductase E subunit
MRLESKSPLIRTEKIKSFWKIAVQEIISKHGNSRASLLPCLEAIQEAAGNIDHESVTYLRDILNIPAVDIYGVISFYSMFNTKAPVEYTIRLCDSVLCGINGSSNILKKVENELGIKNGEHTADQKFALEVVPCLGLCDKAPAMMINEQVYGYLTEEKIERIFASL